MIHVDNRKEEEEQYYDLHRCVKDKSRFDSLNSIGWFSLNHMKPFQWFLGKRKLPKKITTKVRSFMCMCATTTRHPFNATLTFPLKPHEKFPGKHVFIMIQSVLQCLFHAQAFSFASFCWKFLLHKNNCEFPVWHAHARHPSVKILPHKPWLVSLWTTWKVSQEM